MATASHVYDDVATLLQNWNKLPFGNKNKTRLLYITSPILVLYRHFIFFCSEVVVWQCTLCFVLNSIMLQVQNLLPLFASWNQRHIEFKNFPALSSCVVIWLKMSYAWTVSNGSSLPLISCPIQFRIFVVHLLSPPLAINLGTENWLTFDFIPIISRDGRTSDGFSNHLACYSGVCIGSRSQNDHVSIFPKYVSAVISLVPSSEAHRCASKSKRIKIYVFSRFYLWSTMVIISSLTCTISFLARRLFEFTSSPLSLRLKKQN